MKVLLRSNQEMEMVQLQVGKDAEESAEIIIIWRLVFDLNGDNGLDDCSLEGGQAMRPAAGHAKIAAAPDVPRPGSAGV